MAKGYIVSIHKKIIDEEKLKLYGIHAKSALEANAGSYVARGSSISKLEGIIPAIETAHAFAAFEYIEFKEDDIVVVNFSGRGDKDLDTYIDYFKL